MRVESPGAPRLAAIVLISDNFEGVRRLMQALAAQTVREQIEIVLVVKDPATAQIDERALEGFHSVQIVPHQEMSRSTGLGEGVRRARAPIVAMTEDHAMPAPNWAERLIAAYAGDYAAVGPAMRNGNPDSLVSQADFYMGYGPWAEPVKSGEQLYLMGHNCSYKRDLLLSYGPRLAEMMLAEPVLHADLTARGQRLWLEASTVTIHYNYEKMRGFIGSVFFQGRIFAARRASRWSLSRRMSYGILWPLIPLVRLIRVRRDVQRGKPALAKNPKFGAVLLFGLSVDAAGQCVGYLFGTGDTRNPSMAYEFHRDRHFKAAPESKRSI